MRDAEVALLKLMVDKLKAQLTRRAREQYGASSAQLGAQAHHLLLTTHMEQGKRKLLTRVSNGYR